MCVSYGWRQKKHNNQNEKKKYTHTIIVLNFVCDSLFSWNYILYIFFLSHKWHTVISWIIDFLCWCLVHFVFIYVRSSVLLYFSLHYMHWQKVVGTSKFGHFNPFWKVFAFTSLFTKFHCMFCCFLSFSFLFCFVSLVYQHPKYIQIVWNFVV